jgi:hypothetical protein
MQFVWLAGRRRSELPQFGLRLLWNRELFLVSLVLLSPFLLIVRSFVCFNSDRQIEYNSDFAGTSVFYTANVVREQGRGRMRCQIVVTMHQFIW